MEAMALGLALPDYIGKFHLYIYIYNLNKKNVNTHTYIKYFDPFVVSFHAR